MAKKAERGRFSAQKKVDAVLRLLRGEDLDTVSRQLGVTAAKLSEWRDAFVAGGSANLKSHPTDMRDEEVVRLKTLLGEMTMRNEVLDEAWRRVSNGHPFLSRRSKV